MPATPVPETIISVNTSSRSSAAGSCPANEFFSRAIPSVAGVLPPAAQAEHERSLKRMGYAP